MTADEAIEISTTYYKDHHSFPTDIIGKAGLLGIEALLLIIQLRADGVIGNYPLLPGETKD